MIEHLQCPQCGAQVARYRNPVPTVDVIIPGPEQGVVLVKRHNPPYGWALPGGFVDYGESVEQAAVREAKEETGLDVTLKALLGVYSSPDRDPRQHTMSLVFIAVAKDIQALKAGDDAARVRILPPEQWTGLAFDHARILSDFQQYSSGNLQEAEPTPGRSLGLKTGESVKGRKAPEG